MLPWGGGHGDNAGWGGQCWGCVRKAEASSEKEQMGARLPCRLSAHRPRRRHGKYLGCGSVVECLTGTHEARFHRWPCQEKD